MRRAYSWDSSRAKGASIQIVGFKASNTQSERFGHLKSLQFYRTVGAKKAEALNGVI